MGRYKKTKRDGSTVPVHRLIWEQTFGPIPDGCVIHHVDGNGHNNRLDNLMLLTQAQHRELHARLRREGVDPVDPTDPEVIKERERCKEHHARHRDEANAKAREYHATHKEQRRAYREAHKEEIAAYERSRIENHHERELARYHKYYETHKAECNARCRAWSEAHPEERKAYRIANRENIAEQGRAYREAHREERAEWQREYSKKNKERIAEYHKALAQSPEFKARRSAYEKLRRAIKSGKPPEVIAQLQAAFDATKTKK